MPEGTRIAAVDDVPDRGSVLFTVEDAFTNEREAILVPCEEEPGVRAWLNQCPHEAQRLDTGRGAAMRDGEIICPKHGSMFDSCSGDCDNGEAAGTTLSSIDVAVEDGAVLLFDDNYTYLRDGGIDSEGQGPSGSRTESDDDDDGPGSTSHLSF
jgi:nitrite reductase/ring-hydroxylating ferredoxin subunit